MLCERSPFNQSAIARSAQPGPFEKVKNVKHAFVLAVWLLAAVPAAAQPVSQGGSTIVDRDLWEAMAKALGDVPMALPSHQRVQQILIEVAREAQMREARAKAEQKAKAQGESEKQKWPE